MSRISKRNKPPAHDQYVVCPDGSYLTYADLPPVETKRWVADRKALVVVAVETGLITLDYACGAYRLTINEFLSWQRTIKKHGVVGLRVCNLQKIRAKEMLR